MAKLISGLIIPNLRRVSLQHSRLSPSICQISSQQSAPVTIKISNFHTTSQNFNQQPSAAEEQLIKILAESFPKATDIAVVDVSGGCGSMYEVHVQAPDFKNLRTVKQHQLVTKALAKQIKDMHGIRISTSASPCGS